MHFNRGRPLSRDARFVAAQHAVLADCAPKSLDRGYMKVLDVKEVVQVLTVPNVLGI